MKKKDKFNGFKVPKTNTTKCVTHIYGMIKEANPTLLERDDVKKAFNDFVDCLSKYEDKLVSSIPRKGYKYNNGIKIINNNENNCIQNIKFLSLEFTHCMEYETKKVECMNIINVYIPLYELIKHDVIPYMEMKHWEINSKNEVEYYHNRIEKQEELITFYE